VQQAFREQLASKVAALEKKNAAAVAGNDGWLFLTNELRFLSQPRFWGDVAAKISRSRKADAADPIPAIADFHRQLKERGIQLLVVPVPAKAAIYPEKVGVDATPHPSDTAPYLQEFYGELGRHGIEYFDLTPVFASKRDDPRGPVYCRTDSHWSGFGCFLAGQAIAQQVREMLPPEPPRHGLLMDWKEASITGDLVALAGNAANAAPEKIAVRQSVDPVRPDPNSPVLLIGDSHTLVFHEFLAERAGLIDQLAAELRFPVDLIGTRGSGATPVRVSMYRRSRSEPDFLAKKKLVVWCFAARELTEADQGWVVQPIAK
jgi:alginate O-acetyltransferase complex protein AlgJ